jgi:hypothetical protein
VNGTDFSILAGNFGKTGMSFALGDLNGDGAVNGTDFATLAANFGRSLPAPTAALAAERAVAAPEPASLIVKRRAAPPQRSLPGRALPVRRRAHPPGRPHIRS